MFYLFFIKNRPLTESATGRDATPSTGNWSEKLSTELNKTKMTLHNRLKLLNQLFNKSSNDKNLFQFVPSTITKETINPIAVPKWKTNLHNNVNKNSILSRTRHILNSIATAESNTSKLRRIEDLLEHVDHYPKARHQAVKEGAIRILLRTRESTKDENILGKKKFKSFLISDVAF